MMQHNKTKKNSFVIAGVDTIKCIHCGIVNSKNANAHWSKCWGCAANLDEQARVGHKDEK